MTKEYYEKKLAELEKENEQLKKEAESDQLALNESKEIIAELKAQIEKMKNVGNCKHSIKCAEWNEKQCCIGLMKFCLNCKDWELADD